MRSATRAHLIAVQLQRPDRLAALAAQMHHGRRDASSRRVADILDKKRGSPSVCDPIETNSAPVLRRRCGAAARTVRRRR